MCKKNAFTLIELIVVIAIIAILSAIIAPNAFRAIEKAKIAKAVSDFKAIKNACYSLYADTGQWPIVSDTAIEVRNSVLISNANYNWPGWDGPYLEKSPDPHPWAGIYVFDSKEDWGQSPNHEIFLSLDDSCYYGSGSDCEVPSKSAIKIDKEIDDGNLSTGSLRVRAYSNRYLVFWLLVWDAVNVN